MNKAIYLLGFYILFSWNSIQGQNVIVSEMSDTIKNNNISIKKTNFNINGTWGLTNYFNSIIENKEIAKFRLQTPTWFAILIEIKNDSLKTFGSIEFNQYFIEKSNDTLTTLISLITEEKWYLIANNQELTLIQYPNSKTIDSTVYIYRKRDDLNYFSKENIDFYIIGKNVTDYFNEQLFEGKYINCETNQVIVFEDNGKLTGIEGFDSYEVRNYFGTLHPHKNLDVITFSNSKTNESKEYNWVFSDDKLILTEFINEKVTNNGETYVGDYYILGREKMKLKITKPNKR